MGHDLMYIYIYVCVCVCVCVYNEDYMVSLDLVTNLNLDDVL